MTRPSAEQAQQNLAVKQITAKTLDFRAYTGSEPPR
jgi:hypothetical protein